MYIHTYIYENIHENNRFGDSLPCSISMKCPLKAHTEKSMTKICNNYKS